MYWQYVHYFLHAGWGRRLIRNMRNRKKGGEVRKRKFTWWLELEITMCARFVDHSVGLREANLFSVSFISRWLERREIVWNEESAASFCSSNSLRVIERVEWSVVVRRGEGRVEREHSLNDSCLSFMCNRNSRKEAKGRRNEINSSRSSFALMRYDV